MASVILHDDASGASLSIGGLEDACDAAFLRDSGTTHILSCCKASMVQRAVAQVEQSIEVLSVPLLDNGESNLEQGLATPHFTEGHVPVEWMAEALRRQGRVLVQCRSGVNRSVAATLVLMLHCGITLRNSYSIVRLGRPRMEPMDAYLQQIYSIEDKWLGQRSFDRDRDLGGSNMGMLRLASSSGAYDEAAFDALAAEAARKWQRMVEETPHEALQASCSPRLFAPRDGECIPPVAPGRNPTAVSPLKMLEDEEGKPEPEPEPGEHERQNKCILS